MKKMSIQQYRLSFTAWIYQHLLKPLLFRFDPEQVHDRFTHLGSILGQSAILRQLTRLWFGKAPEILSAPFFSTRISSPVGLAAGFDKNARLTNILGAIGFGYEEIGSVTAIQCHGNPKPRLARLPKQKSLAVHYGLTSDGAEAVAARLRKRPANLPLGISLAPTNAPCTSAIEDAIQDYCTSYRLLAPYAAYITLNLSCPNTTADQPFAEPKNLRLLLQAVVTEKPERPLLLKCSPDWSDTQLIELLEVARTFNVSGVILSNLTKKDLPSDGPRGGRSGKLVYDRSNEMISLVRQKFGNKFIIIGCGGIFSPQDALEKLRLGADYLQLITGMIYQGPQLINQINLAIAKDRLSK